MARPKKDLVSIKQTSSKTSGEIIISRLKSYIDNESGNKLKSEDISNICFGKKKLTPEDLSNGYKEFLSKDNNLVTKNKEGNDRRLQGTELPKKYVDTLIDKVSKSLGKKYYISRGQGRNFNPEEHADKLKAELEGIDLNF
jgi:hypothetical protein